MKERKREIVRQTNIYQTVHTQKIELRHWVCGTSGTRRENNIGSEREMKQWNVLEKKEWMEKSLCKEER